MYTVHCTKKLLDRVKVPAMSAAQPPTTVLGNWYATALLWKPQVALIVNERTLLPLLMPLASASSLVKRFTYWPQLILGLNAAAEDDLAARPSHHDGEEEHERDDFASVVIDLPEVADIDVLVASIARLAREQNVLRAKGYLAVKGKPMRLLVQSVGERVRHQFDKPWGTSPRQSKLVVIGEQGDINEGAIRAGLGV